ncbi:hypothetical protein JT358_16370 [Micrococcales bacterium 31B]|nr:hypothetical protein [Micrococcales bacterium 31B]
MEFTRRHLGKITIAAGALMVTASVVAAVGYEMDWYRMGNPSPLPTPPVTDGRVDLVNLPGPLDITESMLDPLVESPEFSALFTFTTTAPGLLTLMSITNPDVSGEYMWIGLNDGRPSMRVVHGGQFVTVYEPQVVLNDGQPHTVTFCAGRTMQQIFADTSSVAAGPERVGIAQLDKATRVTLLQHYSVDQREGAFTFVGQVSRAVVARTYLTSSAQRATSGVVVLPEMLQIQALASAPTPTVWLFSGDSITHGSFHTRGWRSFVQHFEERQRNERGRLRDWVINTGVQGTHCLDILGDWEWRVQRHQAALISLLIGMNDHLDAGAEARLPTFLQEVAQFISRARATGAKLFVQIPNPKYLSRPGEGLLELYNQGLREVCFANQVPVIDHSARWFHDSFGVVPQDLMSDELHPNNRGHYKLASLLLEDLGLNGPGNVEDGYGLK